MKYYFFILLILFGETTFSQIKPDIFPEDLLENEIEVRCYCSPGVYNKSRSRGIELTYGWMNGGTFNEQDYPFTSQLSEYNKLENLEFKLKAPLVLKDNFKLLVGYQHFSEIFSFQNIGADFNPAFRELNNERLKSNSLSLIVSKPIDETRYLAFRFKYTSSGDYNTLFSFNSRYAIYKFLGLYAFKPNENLEWGFGLAVSKSFRRNNILPFILYNKNFNKHWGIEAVLPGVIFGRYNINQSNIFLFGAEYNSESYRIDINEDSNLPLMDYAYNHSEVILSGRIEHRFAPWVWGSIKAGYQFNFSSEFEAKNSFTSEFNTNPTGSPFFNISIFISPPKDEVEHTHKK
ncbi:MAG: DUF6268 family outer membrane beta-barrel protein [Saprospiraceae bacterium]